MISLDIDLSYLAKHFEIGTQRISQYGNKSISEVMEAEAENGNTKALGFEDALKDPRQVAELFRLADATNRYLIIKNLSEDDLSEVLKHLTSEDLAWGLQYFSVDKIMELMEEIPQKELLKIVLEIFSFDDIIALMKPEEMDKFLQSEKVERDDVMNFFTSLKQNEFKSIMTQVFGAEVQFENKEDTLARFENLNDKEFKNLLTKFEDSGKRWIISGLLENDEKLIQEFSQETLIRPYGMMEKGEILKSLDNLDPEFLLPMVEELPTDLKQVVATQIDPNIFAKILVKEFPDVLREIMA